MERFDYKKHTILLSIAGSRAHGMHTSDSDVDVMGVIIAPKDFYIGQKVFEQINASSDISVYFDSLNQEEKDVCSNTKLEGTIYDIKKFIRLASVCNPNLLEGLFCRDEEFRIITEAGRILLDNRDLFLSLKAKATYSGYAHSQLKRIKLHRSFLLNPREVIPSRKDFGLNDAPALSKEVQEAYTSEISRQLDTWNVNLSFLDDSDRVAAISEFEKTLLEMKINSEDKFFAAANVVGVPESVAFILNNEKRFNSAMNEYKHYQDWKKNRNEKRAELERNFGYDTKHAAHLVRLQTTLLSLLKTGTLKVWCDNREFLLDIRRGKYSYDEIVDISEKLEQEVSDLVKNKKYIIREKPDLEKINNICSFIIEQFLFKN